MKRNISMKNKQINTVFSVILLFFFIFIAIPVFVLLKNAFTVGHKFSFSNFVAVGTSSKFFLAFINSVKVSFVSSIITTCLAFFLAYTEIFTTLPVGFKKTLRTLAVFPMLLPTITYGFAIIYSFGKTGLITKLFRKQIFDFYGFKGLVFGYVIYTLPIAFTLLRNTMQYLDKKYIIVSRIMGDNGFKRFYITVFQPLAGTLAVSIIQSFFLSFTDFGIPASIGGRYTVIAELLYNTMLGSIPDFHQGAVIALSMFIPSILSVLILNYLERFNVRYSQISNQEIETNIIKNFICAIGSIFILVCELSIFLVIFIIPFINNWPYDISFTFNNFTNLINDKSLIRVFRNSLIVSLLTASFGTIFVYGAALVTSRSKLHKKASKLIEIIAQITNTLPGMVLGISFLLAFRKTSLHNTIMIIVFCNIVHFFATPFLMMKGTLDKMNATWETTAEILGDNWIKTVTRIVTPNAYKTLLEIFIYLFINGMVTVSAVVFLAGAKTMVVTTKIQELQHFAKFTDIFILSIFIFMTNLIMKTVKGIINNKN